MTNSASTPTLSGAEPNIDDVEGYRFDTVPRIPKVSGVADAGGDGAVLSRAWTNVYAAPIGADSGG